PLSARETIQLGGATGQAWTESGELTFIDSDTRAGSIGPFKTELTENLIATMRSRGGDIDTIVDNYTIPQDWSDGGYEWIIDGDSTTAFVHPPRIQILGGGGGYWTVPMFFDLGAPFVVSRIRWTTRSDHPENQMRRYILYLNDGTEAAKDRVGNIVWTKYREEIDNLESIVDLEIEPQMVRHIYIRPGGVGTNNGLSTTWEVAEMQVFGQGFVPDAEFTSDPIDLGAPSTLGQIQWGSHQDAGGQIIIQTRTGIDDQPYVYWRVTGVGDELSPIDDQGRPLTLSAYERLKPNQRGGITDDLADWSPWQTYDLEKGLTGTQILSPSPRSFIQIRVQFFSDALAGGRVDSLHFEYSQPPVVTSAVGEIFPTQVEASVLTDFTYAVRARIEPGQSGFDALRLRSNALIDTITDVRIDRGDVAYDVDRDSLGMLIRFQRIVQDQSLLEVDFGARVFRYGTPFDGALVDTESDEVPLLVNAGDAIPETLSDELTVRTGLKGAILPALTVSPNPFSPNDDGFNDQVTLSSAVLRLTGDTPVDLQIFDLSGRLIRTLSQVVSGSASFAMEWDGQDEAGILAPPGLYVFRLAVDTDTGSHTRLGQVALVY
ncbi:MAG TPA: gliding motility-associated C-terminal domain-containing protein, partial [Candidatus Latescibacteria bacterium]|nr:gliding motility-associated C-terminal domain-containing protein [Candidatus Latescibacterota bacterium]